MPAFLLHAAYDCVLQKRMTRALYQWEVLSKLRPESNGVMSSPVSITFYLGMLGQFY